MKSRNVALLTNSTSDVDLLLKKTGAKIGIIIFDEGNSAKTNVDSIQMYGLNRKFADEIWDIAYNTTGIISTVLTSRYMD